MPCKDLESWKEEHGGSRGFHTFVTEDLIAADFTFFEIWDLEFTVLIVDFFFIYSTVIQTLWIKYRRNIEAVYGQNIKSRINLILYIHEEKTMTIDLSRV